MDEEGTTAMARKISVYEDVAAELLARIEDGFYSLAQKLPSEYDLAKEFGVSRLTIRKAIDSLVSRNKLMKYKGKGTYIISQQKIQSGSFGLQGFTEVAESRGMKPQTRVIDFVGGYLPTEGIRARLSLQEGELVYHLTRLRLADDEPLIIEELTIPTRYLPNVSQVDLESKSIFSLIEEVVDIGYSHQEVGAEVVNHVQSELLGIPLGAPILQVSSMTFSITSVPIFLETSYYRADKYTFKTILQRKHD